MISSVFAEKLTRSAVCILLAVFAVLAGCGGEPSPEPVEEAQPSVVSPALADPGMMQLPRFVLTSETGESFGSDLLDGKIWIADFIFTRCGDICPLMTASMSRIQKEMASNTNKDRFRMVSITVDPEFDTPAVLRKYAAATGADPDRWTFLTGGLNQIRQLVRHGFKLPLKDNPENPVSPITHSRMLVLVDGEGWVQGLFDGTTDQGREECQAGAERLLAKPVAPRLQHPPGVLDTSWMESRRQAQLATTDQFKVFHSFRFEDRAPESGITFVNRTTDDSGKAYKPVHYDHGNGIAVADVDGDGFLDIYFQTQIGRNELWRNIGGGEFENITPGSGVGIGGKISVAATFADTDNDGDPDLFVTTVRGGNHLFQNDGTGRFTDVTSKSGLGLVAHSSAGIFFDYDRDGLLDLYLCNVGVYTRDFQGPGGYYVGVLDAFAGHLKPEERNELNILYRNLGGNRFKDVSAETGLLDESWSGDATVLDLNEDGWLDLYVLNMQGDDHYWENIGGKKFERKSREMFPRTPWGSMGVKAADFDNDGDTDIFLTDMHSDMSKKIGPDEEKLKSDMRWPESLLQTGGTSIFGNAYFRNDGNGVFTELSDELGMENYWPWGFSTGDLNADGWEDLFITSSMNFGFRYGVNTLLLNNQGERFLDSEFILGVEPRRDGRTFKLWHMLDCPDKDRGHPDCAKFGLLESAVFLGALGSRSAAIFDIDLDGDLDIVTNEFHDGPMVLMSNLADRKKVNALTVRLEGTKSNRDGLGSRVTVVAGGKTYTKVHDGKSGYLSQSLIPLYFGLDQASTVDQVTVVWPSGREQILPGPIRSNQTILIKED